MSTYKDERENEVHEDFTKLSDQLSAVGKNLMLKFGEMFPTSGTINPEGKCMLMDADMGEERPSSQAVYERLRDALRAGMQQKHFRAVGICMNVTAAGPSNEGIMDAIAVELIHSKGKAACLFIPYSTRGGVVVEFGEPFWRT